MVSVVEVCVYDNVEFDVELCVVGFVVLFDDVVVYGIDGLFFFGDVENLECVLIFSYILLWVLIICFGCVFFVDVIVFNMLEEVVIMLYKCGVCLMLSEVNVCVSGKLYYVGIDILFGDYVVYGLLVVVLCCVMVV